MDAEYDVLLRMWLWVQKAKSYSMAFSGRSRANSIFGVEKWQS